MNEKLPSKPATRAAEKIIRVGLAEYYDGAGKALDTAEQDLAELIDDVTGLAELLAACEWTIRQLKEGGLVGAPYASRDPIAFIQAINQLQAATFRARGGPLAACPPVA